MDAEEIGYIWAIGLGVELMVNQMACTACGPGFGCVRRVLFSSVVVEFLCCWS